MDQAVRSIARLALLDVALGALHLLGGLRDARRTGRRGRRGGRRELACVREKKPIHPQREMYGRPRGGA